MMRAMGTLGLRVGVAHESGEGGTVKLGFGSMGGLF